MTTSTAITNIDVSDTDNNANLIMGKDKFEGALNINIKQDHHNHEPSQFLCFDIGYLSKTTQFAICTSGVFFFFLIYGYLSELIFTLDEFKPYGWFLTLIQFCYYSIFGFIETYLRNDRIRKISLRTYVFFSFLTVGTMGLSNSSLGYLNYPTQVIFKCCKLIPVMIGSKLIQKKTYNQLDYIAAFLMSIGLIYFTLADSKVSPIFNVIGVLMISCALLFDSIIGNVQEKTMKKSGASNAEIVLYSYFIGIGFILFYVLVTGEFVPAFQICLNNKVKTYGYAFVFSLTGYIGIQIVLQLVRTVGAFAAVTVTTCRKAMSIAISFLAFQKPFTIHYLYAGLLIVFGIYLNMYSKKYSNFSITGIAKKLIIKLNIRPKKVDYRRLAQEV